MPRNIHSPLIPTPAQCESHEKRALAFALPLLSYTLQKNIFASTVLVEQGVRPEKNQAAKYSGWNIQATTGQTTLEK